MLPDQLGIDLVCPDCRRPLARVDNYYICSDGECRRAYPIVDDIPKLIVDDSTPLQPEEWHERLAAARPQQKGHES
jgi:uncharacterized protein YbaR (Trm112 family)